MKFKFYSPTIFITLLSSHQDQLKWLDLNLSNYDYPYPVHLCITLKVQQQELKMEYMDVKPDNYNGKKPLFCFHGKLQRSSLANDYCCFEFKKRI
jgi:hypothetical protein